MKISYPEFNEINIFYLKKAVEENRVENATVIQLLDYWERELKNFRTNANVRYFEYYVLFESMHDGILNAFIYDLKENQYLFHFKPVKEIARLVFDEVESSGEHFDENVSEIYNKNYRHFFWKKRISFRENHYLLGVVFLNLQSEVKTFNRIETVFKNYYLPEIFLPDERFFSYPIKLDEYMKKKPFSTLQNGKDVTAIALLFSNYKLFIHSAGDFYTEEALFDLKEDLKRLLGNESDIFALGLNCWVIFNYEKTQTEIMEILKRHIIEVRNYMFKFNFYSVALNSLDTSFYSVWKKLLDGLLPSS